MGITFLELCRQNTAVRLKDHTFDNIQGDNHEQAPDFITKAY